MSTSVRIAGTGSYVPQRVVSNDELGKKIQVNPKWIHERTGILERRFAARSETTADLGFRAAQRAIKAADIQAHDLDCIVLTTLSPDRLFPGVGVDVQARLKCNRIPAFDLRNQCNGFVFGLSVATAGILSGQYRRVLVVSSEVHSKDITFNHQNKDLCVLFGDGAGAVVLEGTEDTPSKPVFELHTDGHFANDLSFPRHHAARKRPAVQPHMNKTSVIANSSRRMVEVVGSILEQHNISLHQVDFIVPHQSNRNLIQEMARRLDFPLSRVVINIGGVGNTSSASIPIALDDAVRSNRIKRGDRVLFVSFGAGYSWGASIWKF